MVFSANQNALKNGCNQSLSNFVPRACDPFGLRQGTRDSGETEIFLSDFKLPVLVLRMTLGMASL